jgi:hypothetical protein
LKTLLLRVLLLAALAVFFGVRLWAAVVALRAPLALIPALLVVVILLVSRAFSALQLAALIGAIWIWHWPVPVALMLSVPRVVLLLPGIISTFLASRRHPRLRWS